MPHCLKCSDGSVVCGNPPTCGEGTEALASGVDARPIQLGDIHISAYGDKLRVTSEWPFPSSEFQEIVIRYSNPETLEGLVIHFT